MSKRQRWELPMIRSILAAVGVAAAGLLVFAAPSAADEGDLLPPLPFPDWMGVDPYVYVCTGFSTNIPFVQMGDCSEDVLENVGY